MRSKYLRKEIKQLLAVCTVWGMLMGCQQTEYARVLKAEMASGKVYDSLLFDMKLGDTRKKFYKDCWELNKQGKIWQSRDNKYVQLTLGSQDSTQSTITMLFYGEFDENEQMVGMRMKAEYARWAIWAPDYHSDKLILAMTDTLEKWYPGNDFIKMEYQDAAKPIWVKVDGNRRISMITEDEQQIKIRIDDMNARLSDKKPLMSY